MAFYMKAGLGPKQKTGAGIPSALLQSQDQKDYNQAKKDLVADSLLTVKKEGKLAAAKKFGNKTRAQRDDTFTEGFFGKGLATDSSEPLEVTAQLKRADKNNKKKDRKMPLLQKDEKSGSELTREEEVQKRYPGAKKREGTINEYSYKGVTLTPGYKKKKELSDSDKIKKAIKEKTPVTQTASQKKNLPKKIVDAIAAKSQAKKK